jgi:site-specific recombinase XerD
LEILSFYKDPDSYIFTAENSKKPLEPEAWNRIVNGFIKECSTKLDGKPKLRSHSFRIGYITQLWKDTHDLELVRQTIGHLTLDTTSKYVKELSELSEEERRKRILEIDTQNDITK